MDLTEILKELRVNAGLTQKELAAKLGIGQSTIVGYEKGIREPTVSNLALYAKYFNVSIDYIVGIEDDFGVKVESDEGISANTQEKELLSLFRQLSPYLQGLTLDTVRGWAGSSGSAKSNLQKKA